LIHFDYRKSSALLYEAENDKNLQEMLDPLIFDSCLLASNEAGLPVYKDEEIKPHVPRSL
jgi:hypothetical protein